MQTLLRWTLIVLGQAPLPLLHGLGWLLGSLLWLTPNGFRAVTRRHLELCFPERSPVEREHIVRVLRECGGVVTTAATTLGLHRTTLNAMMRKLGITRKEL